jgi:hypothetical protein
LITEDEGQHPFPSFTPQKTDSFSTGFRTQFQACWAHARRKFFEALKVNPKDQSAKPVGASKSLSATTWVPSCRDWVIFQSVESPNLRPPPGQPETERRNSDPPPAVLFTRRILLGSVMKLLQQSEEHRDHLQRLPPTGLASDYLIELSVQMTTLGDVTISEQRARSIVLR